MTTSQTYSSSGTWTCPAGVNAVKVECWGLGGNGAAGVHPYGSMLISGGGGGGGAYAKRNSIVVHQGSNYSFTVGAPTTITIGSVTCTADYGRNASNLTKGAGGQAANSVGDTITSGTDGANGGAGNGPGTQYGGFGGNSPNGGAGGAGNAPSHAGYPPGGGGGGGNASEDMGGGYTLYAGSSGAAGQITFTWTVPINVVKNMVTKTKA